MTKIESWRAAQDRIRQARQQTLDTGSVARSDLDQVEDISGEIYKEIAEFDALLVEVGNVSPEAAAELGAVGDALRLILLEITELGTGMYSVRLKEGAEIVQDVNPGPEAAAKEPVVEALPIAEPVAALASETPPPVVLPKAPQDPHPSDEDPTAYEHLGGAHPPPGQPEGVSTYEHDGTHLTSDNEEHSMADDKSKRGGGDRDRVSLSEPYEVEYFARKHGIDKAKAEEIIRATGGNREKADQAAEARRSKA